MITVTVMFETTIKNSDWLGFHFFKKGLDATTYDNRIVEASNVEMVGGVAPFDKAAWVRADMKCQNRR